MCAYLAFVDGIRLYNHHNLKLKCNSIWIVNLNRNGHDLFLGGYGD